MAALLFAAVAAIPVIAAPIVVRDDRGHTVTLARPPARIVSLLPSLTETLCQLDACGLLVGTDRYSDWPASVDALPKLGGMDDALLERIVALKPDLVLAARSSRAIERLEELGVPVISLETKTLADSHRVFSLVGTVLGRPRAGELAWRRMDDQIATAAFRVPARYRGVRVYFEVSEGPYAAGASSFIGELLTRLGLGNIVGRDLGPFPKLNPEFIVRERPALIMASARAVEEMAVRPGWEALAAIREHRNCAFPHKPFEILIRPGPRLGEAAGLIADCLVALDKGVAP